MTIAQYKESSDFSKYNEMRTFRTRSNRKLLREAFKRGYLQALTTLRTDRHLPEEDEEDDDFYAPDNLGKLPEESDDDFKKFQKRYRKQWNKQKKAKKSSCEEDEEFDDFYEPDNLGKLPEESDDDFKKFQKHYRRQWNREHRHG